MNIKSVVSIPLVKTDKKLKHFRVVASADNASLYLN